MKINDTINTPHGKATITGFERFNKKGFSAPHATTRSIYEDERIICELQLGHTWQSDSTFYGLYAHEYKALNP
jgi:hypothetical protein